MSSQVNEMTTYKMELKDEILRVNFGEAAQNDRIVQDTNARLEEMIDSGELIGGPLLKVNGPASIPVAFAIAHKVAHLYGAVGCFDPKLGKYVICITHNPAYKLGDLID
ncbi:CRISPR-associated protein Csx3 [Scytonema sp. UIC 10036]|uniref:CRISPR-associated protein Csx3 n=1 Tax=Scytonema sp. UIC 10036 TaxID=2304196 RepID=UPI001FAA92B1|nr:CRISPR-associated protein Csx3 [Scytonema sp. UIC 10036]